MNIKLALRYILLIFAYSTAHAATFCPPPKDIVYNDVQWQILTGPLTTGWNIVKQPGSLQTGETNLTFSYAEWMKISNSDQGILSCHYRSNNAGDIALVQKTGIPKSRYWVNAGSARVIQVAPLPHYICAAPAASECY